MSGPNENVVGILLLDVKTHFQLLLTTDFVEILNSDFLYMGTIAAIILLR